MSEFQSPSFTSSINRNGSHWVSCSHHLVFLGPEFIIVLILVWSTNL